MRRVAMAGSDVAVTDRGIAELVIEYAMRLGRAGTTDTVTVPVALGGQAHEATILLGPASQVTVGDNEDLLLDAVELPGVEEALADLQRRIDGLTGHLDRHEDEHDVPTAEEFPDLGVGAG